MKWRWYQSPAFSKKNSAGQPIRLAEETDRREEFVGYKLVERGRRKTVWTKSHGSPAMCHWAISSTPNRSRRRCCLWPQRPPPLSPALTMRWMGEPACPGELMPIETKPCASKKGARMISRSLFNLHSHDVIACSVQAFAKPVSYLPLGEANFQMAGISSAASAILNAAPGRKG